MDIAEEDMRREIYKSKLTYCSSAKDEHKYFDIHITHPKDVNNDFIDKVKEIEIEKEDKAVIRMNDLSLVPEGMLSTNKNGKKEIKVECPIIPFRHYIHENGELKEVMRALWKGDLDTGEPSHTHGRMTEQLGKYILEIANWHFYTKHQGKDDEYLSFGIMHLYRKALRYDEIKGGKVLNYYSRLLNTAMIDHYRILKRESKIKRR